MCLTDQPHCSNGERSAGTPRNGEQRPNGEIQQGAKEGAVFLSYLVCQGHYALAPADAQGDHCQHRNANGGDKYPQKGHPQVAAGIDAHLCRKNQVSRTKEHAKQHTCNGDGFLCGKIAFHEYHPLFFSWDNPTPFPGAFQMAQSFLIGNYLEEIFLYNRLFANNKVY